MKCKAQHDSGLVCDKHKDEGDVHSGLHPDGGRVYWREPGDLLAISANVDECDIRRWPGNHEEHVAVNVFPGLDGASDMCIERGLSHVFVVEQSANEHVVVRNVYQDASPMVRMIDALTHYSFDAFLEWCMVEHREGRLDLSASKFVRVIQRFDVDVADCLICGVHREHCMEPNTHFRTNEAG